MKYSYQYPHFSPDQVHEGGIVTKQQAIEIVKDFPFKDFSTLDDHAREVTLPTVIFEDGKNGSSLAIWYGLDDRYSIECTMAKHEMSVTTAIGDIQVLTRTVEHFFDNDWQSIVDLHGYKESSIRRYIPHVLFYGVIPIFTVFSTMGKNGFVIADFFLDSPSIGEQLAVQFMFVYLVMIIIARTYPLTGSKANS